MNKDFDPYPCDIYNGDYEPDYALKPPSSEESDEAFENFLRAHLPSKDGIKRDMEKLRAQGYNPPECPEELPF